MNSKNEESQTFSKKIMKAEEKKISLLERSMQMGPVVELVTGFSFDSDSEISLND